MNNIKLNPNFKDPFLDDDLLTSSGDYSITQLGGSDSDSVVFTILYKKNYKLELNDELIQESFEHLYLVTDDYSAYEMQQTYIPTIYSITLTRPTNKLFRFKFMRNELLEFLDEDMFLKSIPRINPDYHEPAYMSDAYSYKQNAINGNKTIINHFKNIIF